MHLRPLTEKIYINLKFIFKNFICTRTSIHNYLYRYVLFICQTVHINVTHTNAKKLKNMLKKIYATKNKLQAFLK